MCVSVYFQLFKNYFFFTFGTLKVKLLAGYQKWILLFDHMFNGY